MQIEIDRKAIFAKETVIDHVDEEKELGKTAGYSEGNKIVLTPDTSLELIATYCHESGHYMGDIISFQNGKVLSFDEIRLKNIAVDLTPKEILFLKEHLENKAEMVFNSILLSIGNKLLEKFFKGKYQSDSLNVKVVSQHQMDDLMREDSSTGLEKRGKDFVIVNSKSDRDDEIGSIFTEYACLFILENTIVKYGLNLKPGLFNFDTSSSPSHQRAQNIVARAFYGRGYRLPSSKDLFDI